MTYLIKHIFVTLLLILFVSTAVAQTKNYTIQSFEGKSQTISLTDIGQETAIIKYQNTKLVIDNFWGLRKATVVKQKFLKIEYAVRGGSCVGINYVILLCVSHNKLFIPLNLMTMLSGCGAGEEDLYTLKFYIQRIGNSYQMPITIHNERKTINLKVGRSFNKHYTVNLKFDLRNKIFYNRYETIKGNFITGFTDSNKPIHESINGTFPLVKVRNSLNDYTESYYINGKWYENGQENYLITFVKL